MIVVNYQHCWWISHHEAITTSGGAKNIGWRQDYKIESKKLININNKINKQLYNNVIII